MTVKEIAELAGVSIGTVDRVLHNRGRVSRSTRDRIEAIIKDTGFSPNPIARRLKRNREYRLYALVPQRLQDSGYWGQVRQGILEAADEITSMGVVSEVMEFDRYDEASFHRATGKVLESECDGILLAPIMPDESRVFIHAIEGKIPYVFFDAHLPDTHPLVTIGQNSFRGGYLAGRLASLYARGQQGSFAIMTAHAEDYHIKRRREGFLDFASSAGYTVVLRENVDLEREYSVQKELESLATQYPDLLGVFVTSASAHRIAQAAWEFRKKRPLVVIGYDLVLENHSLLLEGKIDAIISQRPEFQGRRGLLDLYRSIVLGRSVQSSVEIPLDVYIRENAPVLKKSYSEERPGENKPFGTP